MPDAFDIKKAVREIFDGKTTVDQARVWIEEKIQAHKDLMPVVKGILEGIVESYMLEVQNKNHRMAAELFSDKKNMVKVADSILEKIWRSRKDQGTYTKENFHETMEDIMRFRILCNYLKDIEALKKILPREIMKIKGYELHNGPKDFIMKDPEDRKKGHRAVHFVFRMNHSQKNYLFEVQLMTLLQHAWDKKDHHLVYEYHRNGEEVPMELKIRSYAMSEMLYIADDFFNSILEDNQPKGGE